eukprot:3821211-Pyramimonas_sp.AAC.1
MCIRDSTKCIPRARARRASRAFAASCHGRVGKCKKMPRDLAKDFACLDRIYQRSNPHKISAD